VCVYRATQRGRLPLAQSLLRSADVPFVVTGEFLPQLTGLDAYGPAQLHVSAVDANDARRLLADLDDPATTSQPADRIADVWSRRDLIAAGCGAAAVGVIALGDALNLRLLITAGLVVCIGSWPVFTAGRVTGPRLPGTARLVMLVLALIAVGLILANIIFGVIR
jgi:hypothetical protein